MFVIKKWVEAQTRPNPKNPAVQSTFSVERAGVYLFGFVPVIVWDIEATLIGKAG